MNKKDKEVVLMIKKLVKEIEKGFGPACPELNLECGVCKSTMLIAHLEWYKDLIEWRGDFTNETKKNGKTKK